jgi:hypothetical protein
MHRSSDTIASLAAALAKAQMALTNPEKSLTGTLPGNRADEPGYRACELFLRSPDRSHSARRQSPSRHWCRHS